MTCKIVDGKALAATLRTGIKSQVARLAAQGLRPGLAVILAGDDPASRVYVRNKIHACEEAGLRSTQYEYAADVTEADLLERIAALNADPATHGILVQLPLPGKLPAERILSTISPAKDVDGFHAESLGALLAGRPGFIPCTPAGIMKILEHERVPLAGRRAVVIGRSTIVGKPVALLLLQEDATVTLCHSKTARLAELTREADVLVAAVGRARMVTADMVKPGACVIDVGINRLPDGRLTGDVDFESVRGVAGVLTPVPGGVGPMTIAMLLDNTLRAAATLAARP